MNNEIKEILDKLKDREETYRFCKQYKLAINDWIYEAHYLLDYIINLQQENHELKSKLECYENGAYYSSKVDELEQENKKLTSLCIGHESELRTKDIIIKQIRNEQQEDERLKEDYKSRCEKAIEYNKEIVDNYLEEDECEYCDGRYATAKHNLNILQNGSEDNEKVNL